MFHLFATNAIEISPSSKSGLAFAICVYILFLFAISLVASRRVKTESDYLIAGRKLPLFLAWGTLIATWFALQQCSLLQAQSVMKDFAVLCLTLCLCWHSRHSGVLLRASALEQKYFHYG